jgi:ABC-type glycerol-3-phosphate transport system substrate-binding protein
MRQKIKFLIILICTDLIFTVSCKPPTLAPTPTPQIVHFAYLGSGGLDYDQLAQVFEAQEPGVTIELDRIAYGPQINQLVLDSFHEADVVRLNSAYILPEQIAQLRTLDALIESDGDFPREDFFPGALHALQVDNQQIGLPAGIAPMVMFVEGMRFKIANTPILPPDYSLDDLLMSAKAIHNQDAREKESGKFAYGFCTSPLINDILIISLLFGGGFFDQVENPTRPTLNRPENIDAVRWYASLWQEPIVVPEQFSNLAQVYGPIGASQCGYWMGYYYQLGFIAESIVDLHILPLPIVKEPVQLGILDGYYLTKNAASPEAAWKWMRFLIEHTEASGKQLPPRISQVQDEGGARLSADVQEVARRMVKQVDFVSMTSMLDERIEQVYTIYLQAVERVIRGQASAEEALDAAQLEAEEVLTAGK